MIKDDPSVEEYAELNKTNEIPMILIKDSENRSLTKVVGHQQFNFLLQNPEYVEIGKFFKIDFHSEVKVRYFVSFFYSKIRPVGDDLVRLAKYIKKSKSPSLEEKEHLKLKAKKIQEQLDGLLSILTQ